MQDCATDDVRRHIRSVQRRLQTLEVAVRCTTPPRGGTNSPSRRSVEREFSVNAVGPALSPQRHLIERDAWGRDEGTATTDACELSIRREMSQLRAQIAAAENVLVTLRENHRRTTLEEKSKLTARLRVLQKQREVSPQLRD